jgi:hypothetical protein
VKRNLFAGRRRSGGIDMYQRVRDIVDAADRELAGA